MNWPVLATLILPLVPLLSASAVAGDGTTPMRHAASARTVADQRTPATTADTRASGRDVNKPIKGEYLPRSVFTRSLRQRGPDLTRQQERQAIADGWR